MESVDRGGDVSSIDKDVKNKFRWDWLDLCVQVKSSNGNFRGVPISEWIIKINSPGKAKCKLCTKILSYGSKGKSALLEHCNSESHMKCARSVITNFTLPGVQNLTKPSDTKPLPQAVPLPDRVANAEVSKLKIINIVLTSAERHASLG